MNVIQNSIHPRVVLILVDGMRPDGLTRANTPAMDEIMQMGTFSLKAETTFPSITLPCHASLLQSVPPERHGITSTWVPQARPVPSLFDVLNQAGKISAFFYNWEELRDLSSPGSLAISLMLRKESDWELTQAALQWLTTHDFDFAFIYLGNTDSTGHKLGWMSKPYLTTIQEADRCIGQIMETLPDETCYIVMADHGGHLRNHGTRSKEDMRIPVLAKGPGIKQGNKLGNNISIMDIAPSILQILNVPRPKEWMGTTIFHDLDQAGV